MYTFIWFQQLVLEIKNVFESERKHLFEIRINMFVFKFVFYERNSAIFSLQKRTAFRSISSSVNNTFPTG